MINRLSQILNARWLINQEVVYNYIPMLISFLKGGNLDLLSAAEKETAKPYCLSAGSSDSINLVNKYDLLQGDFPSNSIAIIPIQGIIMSDDSIRLVNYLSLAEANPNVVAIILLVNTPGGMVFYIDIAANYLKGLKKPVVSYVLNMSTSAAMWLISSSKKIILSSPIDRVGSIGVMTSVMDFSRLLSEFLKIDQYDIYADASTDKNGPIRKLLDSSITSMEERTSLIREELNFVNDIFHQAIQTNLGIDKSSEVFTGKTYYAQKAIELGLAHEINSFEYAVNLAHQMGQINQFINLNN